MPITKKQVQTEVKKAVKEHQKQVDEKLKKLEKDLDKDLKTSKEDLYSNLLEKTKQQAKSKTLLLHSKFKEHSSTAIIAALSFVIGLTWRDFIVKIVDNVLKPHLVQKYPYISELITAIVVTLFAILAIAFVSKWAKKSEEEKNKN